ncbi:MAG: hypothetical protein QME44_00510 [Thermodesulfobacteriota bacterium]|nr:hypothetical protein [Thermodesulfobacteriota bacterium]
MDRFSSVETLMIVQVGIEIILVLVVIFLLLKFRETRFGRLNHGIENVSGLIHETEKICRTLANNLNEKRALADKLLSDMDHRIGELRKISERAAESTGCQISTPHKQAAVPYTNVVELSRYGLSADEIAERLSMTMGEVELVLGLAMEKREANNSR